MFTRLVFWSLTAALAGFLFGFDTVVISGAEQTIQELWDLGDGQHGLAMSMALWGTVFGSLVGGWPTDRIGRRQTLLFVGILYFVSAVGSAFAPEVYSFMVARFIGGVGVGVSTVAAPLYIAEIAPAKHRGRLARMFQFNIVFGILIAFVSNALLAGVGEHAWRWMLGVEAFPALVYTVCCRWIPKSPRWLIARKGQRDAALEVMRLIHPNASEAELREEVDQIEASAHRHRAEGAQAKDEEEEKKEEKEKREDKKGRERGRFFTAGLRTPILLAFLIAFFNQLSGINAVLYFAPRIFELTGLEEQAALLQSVGIGVTNLVFTFVGLYLIDRLGRRTLLYIGSFGYIASLGLCAWAFYTEHFGVVPPCIFAFIAAHAVGQGAVIWVFISEIFPNRNRAQGQALGSFTHWLFAALLTLAFPSVVRAFAPGTVFLFFCGMMILQLVWVRCMVPETKGVSLEDMEAKLGIH